MKPPYVSEFLQRIERRSVEKRVFARPDLNVNATSVFEAVVAKAGATPSDIMAITDLDSATVAKHLRTWSDRGLLGVEMGTEDRRSRHYYLTKAGAKVAAQLAAANGIMMHVENLPTIDGRTRIRPGTEVEE